MRLDVADVILVWKFLNVVMLLKRGCVSDEIFFELQLPLLICINPGYEKPIAVFHDASECWFLENGVVWFLENAIVFKM